MSTHFLSLQNFQFFLCYFSTENLFALNRPKLAWCRDRWNANTMYAVQLICIIFCCFFLHNVHIKECTFLYFTTYYSRGRQKIKLTNVEIQEQTASFIREKFKINSKENLENNILFKVRQGTLKFKFNVGNQRIFWVNLPIVFIYFYFMKKKFNYNHQENLENIV